MLRTALLRAPGTWAFLLLSLTLGGLFVARRADGWVARALGLDCVLESEQWRAEKIAYTHGLIEQRLQHRKAVGRALLRGELTLREAAVRFRELDSWPPRESWDQLRRRHPNVSEEEFHCLTVIEFTRVQLADDPAQARALAERLGQELEALRARLVDARPDATGEEWF